MKDEGPSLIDGLSLFVTPWLLIKIVARSTVKTPEKLMDAPLFESVFPNLNPKINDQLKLLWIATCKDDGEFNFSMEFKLWLKSKNIHFDEIITPGQHTWLVGKRNLVHFSQLLFKK